jgi:hypothetical protein
MPGFGNVLPSPGLMVSLVTPIPDNLHAHTCFVGGQQVRSVPPVDARTTMGCAQCSLRARLHQRTIAKLAEAKAYSLICLRPSAKQLRTKECGEVEARADKPFDLRSRAKEPDSSSTGGSECTQSLRSSCVLGSGQALAVYHTVLTRARLPGPRSGVARSAGRAVPTEGLVLKPSVSKWHWRL